jgi:hypothetical protein
MKLPATTTEITMEWLNHVLTANGFLDNNRIVSVDREKIGVGEGFISDMARIKLVYDRETSILPKTIIAKFPTSFPPVREMANKLRIFEREIRFYNEIAPESPIRTPQIIYTALDIAKDRYIMLMEDCSHYSPADPQLDGLSFEQVKIITLKIADFHAYWWNHNNLYSFPWMPKPGSPERKADIPAYKSYWATCSKDNEFKQILPKGGWEAGQKISDQRAWLDETEPKNNLTIIHMDLRADNMFFDYENRENPLILFDWSVANVARGVVDLSFLLGFSLDINLRRETERDILKLYWDRLNEKGITGYSFEECQKDYLRGLILRTDIPITTYARADRSSPRGAKVARIMLQRWFTSLLDNNAVNILP